MDLKNKLKNSIWIFALSGSLMAQTSTPESTKTTTDSLFVKEQLVELLAKQATNNLRFITNDGKITYYQKRSGQLLVSQNYKVAEILKGTPANHYTITATKNRKKMIVSENPNFHTYYSLRGVEKIHVLNFGQSVARYVGEGNSPRLHLNDEWLSYYHHQNKTLSFEHTTNSALKFQITLNAKKNPYFTPEVVMFSDDQILYSDMNEDGFQGIFLFKRSTGKSELKYKQNSRFSRIELCDADDRIYLGEFGSLLTGPGSSIKLIQSSEIENFKDPVVLYTSALNDPGNLHCRENNILYFSKNIGASNTKSIYEIISLDLTTKKEQVLTYFKSTFQIVDMDGVYLVSEKGKSYIVKGNNNFKFIDILAAPDKGEAL